MPSREYCGDCTGGWGCHDCPYTTPEAIEKRRIDNMVKASTADRYEAQNKKLKQELSEVMAILNESLSILKALKYENNYFYRRAGELISKLTKNQKKDKKNV